MDINDLAELNPVLAKSLTQLLEFEGDIYETMCLNFTISVNIGNIHDSWGAGEEVPLCAGGSEKIVTQENKQEWETDFFVFPF